MRKINVLLVVVLLMCSVSVFAEDNSDNKIASLDWIGGCVVPDYDKIYYALELDPIGYFEPQNINTDLEKKLYKKTTEYKENLLRLKDIRNKITSTRYCIETGFEVNEYNTKKRSIEINMGQDPIISIMPGDEVPAKTAMGFYFPSFKTFERKHDLVNGLKVVIYPLQLEEDKALVIERKRDSLKTYLVFSLDKILSYQFKAFVSSGNPFGTKLYKLTKKFIKAKNVSLVLADPEEKKVYLRKDILDKK